MKATIWHNPGCGTSRKTLEILHDTPGVEVTVVEYLKNPPSAAKLAQLYRDAGITPSKACGRGAPMPKSAACHRQTTPLCWQQWRPNRSSSSARWSRLTRVPGFADRRIRCGKSFRNRLVRLALSDQISIPDRPPSNCHE